MYKHFIPEPLHNFIILYFEIKIQLHILLKAVLNIEEQFYWSKFFILFSHKNNYYAFHRVLQISTFRYNIYVENFITSSTLLLLCTILIPEVIMVLKCVLKYSLSKIMHK